MPTRTWIFVLLLLTLYLPAHAQTAPDSPAPEPFPKALQGQVDAKFEAANPSPSPDGLTFTPVTGYNGPTIKPFNPGDPHHIFMPSIVVAPDEKLVYCTTGTTLALAGNVIPQSFLRAALEVDHRPEATDEVCKITQDYLFYWKSSELGSHTLRVVFTPDDGSGPIITRTVRVVVSDSAPCSLDALPSTIRADTQIPISRASVPDFKPSRTMVVVGDDGFDIADTQKALVIPASKLPHGAYVIAVASFTADGTRFVSMPQIVVVQHEQ